MRWSGPAALIDVGASSFLSACGSSNPSTPSPTTQRYTLSGTVRKTCPRLEINRQRCPSTIASARTRRAQSRTANPDDVADYRYDVAFSFLDRDEALVRRLVEQLGPDVSVFFSAERQGELCRRRRGVVTFTSVFRREARTVAIGYRDEWGSTTSTIELNAIRERGFSEHGYDFATLIPLDPTAGFVADVPLDEYVALVTAFYSALNVITPEDLLHNRNSICAYSVER
jgi:hypothetical protein